MGKNKKDKGFGFISSLKKRKIPKRKGWYMIKTCDGIPLARVSYVTSEINICYHPQDEAGKHFMSILEDLFFDFKHVEWVK